MNTAMGEASYPVFGSVKWNKVYVGMEASPLRPIQMIVEWTPLYQVVVLLRDLTLGVVGPGLLWRAAYLAVLGVAGLFASGRRIGKLLLVRPALGSI